MRKTLRCAWLLAGLLAVVSPLRAADKHAPEDAKALTLQAVALIQSKGLDAARPVLHDNVQFRHDELYVNVIDMTGIWKVYPPMPAGEGRSVADIQDATGKFIVREIIKVARDSGEGWVEYRWLNPATKEIGPKESYVKRVPDTDLVVYVGVYR